MSERVAGDYLFLGNMYKLIKRKSFFDPYKWKKLDRMRLKLAVVYFKSVIWFSREVVFKV